MNEWMIQHRKLGDRTKITHMSLWAWSNFLRYPPPRNKKVSKGEILGRRWKDVKGGGNHEPVKWKWPARTATRFPSRAPIAHVRGGANEDIGYGHKKTKWHNWSVCPLLSIGLLEIIRYDTKVHPPVIVSNYILNEKSYIGRGRLTAKAAIMAIATNAESSWSIGLGCNR